MAHSIVSAVFIIIPVLVNVAFFTLLERKILGLSQSRKGPNKVSIGGFLQPFADAVKLFLKEMFSPVAGNTVVFLVSPGLGIFLVLWIWGLMPTSLGAVTQTYSILLLLVILSLNLYPPLLAGWSSNSKYALIGAMRGVAQTISYEISLALLLLSFLCIIKSSEIFTWLGTPMVFNLLSLMSPVLVLWLVSCVAETNRTPFDFAEGESELVSGFNVEYGAGGFALIFMAEYASILFLSLLSALLLLSGGGLSFPGAAGMVSVGYFWVWLRATLPRYRYDKLMGLAWKSILPAALGWLLLYLTLAVSMF